MLHAHSVFATKFRHEVYTGPHLERLKEITRAVCGDSETELAEFNGESDHAHPLENFPPKVTLSKLVNSLKGVSSRRMRTEFPQPARRHWRANRLRSGSYFAGLVGGTPISIPRQYIQQQNRPARDR